VFFQAFIPQREPGFIPVNDLEFVAFFVAEHKHLSAEHITAHFLLDDGSETVDGFAKIDRFTVQQHSSALPINHDSDFIRLFIKAASHSVEVSPENCNRHCPCCSVIVLPEGSSCPKEGAGLAVTKVESDEFASLNFLSLR